MSQSFPPAALLGRTLAVAAIAGALMYLSVRDPSDKKSTSVAAGDARALELKTPSRRSGAGDVQLWFGDQKVTSYAEVKALRESIDPDAALGTLYENTRKYRDEQYRMLREDFHRNQYDTVPDGEQGITLADIERMEAQGLMIQ